MYFDTFLHTLHVYKRVFEIFLFRSWVIDKNVKSLVSVSLFLQITQDLNKIKNFKRPFVDIGK